MPKIDIGNLEPDEKFEEKPGWRMEYMLERYSSYEGIRSAIIERMVDIAIRNDEHFSRGGLSGHKPKPFKPRAVDKLIFYKIVSSFEKQIRAEGESCCPNEWGDFLMSKHYYPMHGEFESQ